MRNFLRGMAWIPHYHNHYDRTRTHFYMNYDADEDVDKSMKKI
jgi:hypothetical protein